ncbi:site-specific integrase [Mycobacterium sp. 1465703.0]|uniref:tyrosine-type recombinase/integrase n=1 Tax=Mycobacterium sp. 1465703.0 TaxID=1834078 RepID=UPI0007FE54F1|nr:site-specific integrase [Mycobacterium sp. 1465703.0]OBI97995.1 integrase [Mycobacterium sp. 1465703.0]
MASIRTNQRKDGTTAYRVFFRYGDGRQSCYTFQTEQLAQTFKTAVNQLGAEKAIALHRLDRQPRAAHSVTVTEWVQEHIDHLTGAQADTVATYRAYLKNDIAPTLGSVPLDQLTDRDVARWIQGMTGSPKTIANKQRFLSSALTAAVKADKIAANPAAGARIPRGEKREMVFLSRDEFAILLNAITEPWRPLVEFLVASGCRWGEATSLRPSDVNREDGTVRIARAWKYSSDTGYTLGATKTRKSLRTINVPKTVLDRLDYSHEWLFVNRVGAPVRIHGFAPRVWRPAIKRAEPKIHKTPRVHDLRHTCASWLIQAGIPLPVIQQHLGHESIETTVGTYGHLDRRSAQAAADVMGKLLDPTSQG